MASSIAILGLALVAVLLVSSTSGRYFYDEEPLLYDTFPEDFVWACATSAYQIEGAWDADGKGPSIWDTFTHEPGHIADGTNGDVACNTYERWEDDIQLLSDLGVSYYRFSIAWTRILPQGTGEINQAGLDWYSQFVDGLLAAGITPMVTLYHWDLPQALEDQGGWLSDESSDWYLAYADIVLGALGDRVKLWITFNEPWVATVQGYGIGNHAPGKQNLGEYPYQASHNMLLAHGKTYRLYKDKYAAQGGQMGITLNVGFAIPDGEENQEASDRSIEFSFGWYANPVLVNGDYPAVMRERVDAKSEAQGFETSRLPYFTEDEKIMLNGTSDFLGLNYYTGSIVGEAISDINDISYFADSDTYSYADDSWYGSGSVWLKVAPFTLRMMLNWIKDHYNNVPVYITENGVSDRAGNLDDMNRVFYYKHYINNVLKAIKVDGCNVQGYTAWSLMDNFEWAEGYVERFGLHFVDYEDPNRARTQKNSAKYYAQLIANNGFVDEPGCILE